MGKISDEGALTMARHLSHFFEYGTVSLLLKHHTNDVISITITGSALGKWEIRPPVKS